ncbi:MAG: hypothetical protein CM15mP49_22560 [Actinomycetota bacterium]|nr:MAG: hypothetical protein CM15mP49_22560 [Actinomycetota bacterium]
MGDFRSCFQYKGKIRHQIKVYMRMHLGKKEMNFVLWPGHETPKIPEIAIIAHVDQGKQH